MKGHAKVADLRTMKAAGQLVTADRSACIGSGNCVMWAAGTFDLDDRGLVILLESSDDDAAVLEAVRNCPAQALSLQPAP
jgi:ferredoxin